MVVKRFFQKSEEQTVTVCENMVVSLLLAKAKIQITFVIVYGLTINEDYYLTESNLLKSLSYPISANELFKDFSLCI